MGRLIEELGSLARAATAAEAAAAGDFVVVAVPLKLANDMPAAELAGKVVIETTISNMTAAHVTERYLRNILR